uniref:Interferon alpha n=1 Tax=Gallus gallus TaxID=9031 RepID=A0A8V0YIQ0_CHICK
MAVPASPQHPRGYGILLLTLLLKALATTASACNHLRPQDATFSHDSLQLLRDMAPTLPQLCPQHNASLLLQRHHPGHQQHPASRQNHPRHPSAPLHNPQQPQHSSPLERQPTPKPPHRIHRYTQHLEQCLDSSDTRSRTRWPRNLHLTIKKHFSCLHTFLQDNDYSACAWEHVRLQARAWFLSTSSAQKAAKAGTPAAGGRTVRFWLTRLNKSADNQFSAQKLDGHSGTAVTGFASLM